MSIGIGLGARVASGNTGVSVWGDNSYGQLNVPGGLTNVVAVSCGASGNHTLALTSDGRVVAWGWNADGQTNVPAGLKGVIGIAAGESHNLVITSNGTVVAWGKNFYGQTNVPPGLSNVIAVAGGSGHSLALKADGTVVSWGIYSTNSQPPGLSHVVAIAAGVSHNLALRADGTVVTWGDYAPPVPPGLSNVIAIAAGAAHSVALKADGSVVVWGMNFLNQTNMPPGLAGVVRIAAGYGHTLALKSDHSIVAWGSNYQGQTNIPPGLTNALLIAGGYVHSVAVVSVPDAAPKPVILSHPASQAVTAGSNVIFRVTASGGDLGFQWRFNGTNLSGSPKYVLAVGASDSSLTINNVQPVDAGLYSVVVSNTFGSVVSSNALLTVLPPVNHRPFATNHIVVLSEDTSAAITLFASDPENDSLTYTILTQPTNGVLSGVPPAVAYTPAPNYFGPDQFTFHVSDGQTNSAVATVFITVLPVNDAPVARLAVSPLVQFDGVTNLVLIAPDNTNATAVLDGSQSTDVENDPLEFSWLDGTNFVAAGIRSTNKLAVGTHELTLLVSDGADIGLDTQTVEVLTPGASVGVLIARVDQAVVPRNSRQALNASARNAAAAFDRGSVRAGINELQAFENKVRIQVAPFDSELARALINDAEEIIRSLAPP